MFCGLSIDYGLEGFVCRYRMQLEPPDTFLPRTCDAKRVGLASYESSCRNKLLYVAMLDSSLLFIVEERPDASLYMLQKKMTADSLQLTYKKCVDTCILHKAQLFDEDHTQISVLLVISARDEKAWIRGISRVA